MFLKDARVKSLRLKQLVSAAEHFDPDMKTSKIDTVREVVESVTQGDDKVIIFAQFKVTIQALLRELKDYNPVVIAGYVDDESRKTAKDTFNNNEDCRVIIMSDSGAESLNLQRASYVIHYDLTASVEKFEQKNGRAHRNGQTKPVTVYQMVCDDTIDDVILLRQRVNRRMSADVLGDDIDSDLLTLEDMQSILGLNK
jgi:SNF2 family DNA or RNA helicase